MDNIKIESGVKRITVNDDPSRVITFNPTDVTFAERFYGLIREFEEKQAEYERRSKALDEGAKVKDANGLPANVGEGLAFMREVCEFMRDRVDHVFGAGTTQAICGDALSFDAFGQFFEGIAPFFEQARTEKITRYVNQKNAGRVMR